MSDLDRFLKPIFLITPSTRCGSNYLKSVLSLHPHVQFSHSPILEDHFLKDGSLLLEYATRLSKRYSEYGWNPPVNYYQEVLGHMGTGLLSLLYSDIEEGKRVVTKTPDSTGLELFDVLFPISNRVFLVRDGRSVVDSMMRAFNMDFDSATIKWREGVRNIYAYSDTNQAVMPIFKFEDFIRDENTYTRQLLIACDLDPEVFPFIELRKLPLLGSSYAFGEYHHVHWNPVQKPDGFNPLNRYQRWDKERLKRFTDLAGDELKLLGYE